MRKTSLCILLIFVLLFAACSRGDTDAIGMPMSQETVTDTLVSTPIPTADAQNQFAAAEPETSFELSLVADEDFEPVPVSGETAAIPRMIIRSADMGLQTYYFEETVTNIQGIMNNRGGFVENSRQWMATASRNCDTLLWRAEFILRVPVGLFDQVNRELVALGQVRRFSTTSEDVTLEFNDLGSRLRIREEELRRTEVMLDAATELTDIINLESRLTTLRLAVDAYRRRMTEIDQLASFSTIHMTVYEVIESDEEYEEAYYPILYNDTFGTRIIGAFSASVDFITAVATNIAVFLALVGLPLILFAAVGFVIYLILKKAGLWKRPFWIN